MPVSNVKTRWVGGDLVFYDKSGDEIARLDGTNRKLTIAAGSVLAVTDGLVPISFAWDPNAADASFFVAPRAYTVKKIDARVEVAGTDAGAVTAVIKKAPSGTDIASGTALHTGTINLKGTADTNQALTLEAAANLAIAAGDAIGFDLTGTPTAARGCVTVWLGT